MNKAELINALQDKLGLSKKQDAEKAINAFTEIIIETLNNGDKVQIIGFGTFEAKKRSAHEGVNPRTGQPINIAETVVPTFKAGKAFKDSIK
jgi:DNA-binding protein HU-beta